MINSAYSPVRHFAYAVLLNHDPRHAWFVMLKAFTGYFDASGDFEDPKCQVITVGGWVSTVQKWNQFDKEWKGTLDGEGITALHMKDFIHSRREFATWRGDDPRRDKFMAALVKTMKKRFHKAFACSVVIDHYDEVNALYRLRERWGQPYCFAAYTVVGMIHKWMKHKHPCDPIEYIFENGDPEQENELRPLLQREGVDPVFKPKYDKRIDKWWYPFQSADFVAWENRDALTKAVNNEFTDFRRSFQEIDKIPRRFTLFHKDNLISMCKRHVVLRSA